VNGGLLAVDLMFFASTSTKLLDGGWFPLLIACVIAFLMLTWRRGEEILDQVRLEVRKRTAEFIEGLKANPPRRIPGTAIVLGRMTKGVPLALSQNLKHNGVLHENVFLVAVESLEVPRVPDVDRGRVTPISDGISRIELRFGFMERPDVPKGLETAMGYGHLGHGDLRNATYYTGHETIIPNGRRAGMARWREVLFGLMHRNAQRPGAYFNIPHEKIMEIGIELEI